MRWLSKMSKTPEFRDLNILVQRQREGGELKCSFPLFGAFLACKPLCLQYHFWAL